MKKPCSALLSFLLFFLTQTVLAIEPDPSKADVRLVTGILEPYQVYDQNQQLTGTGISAIQCLEKQSGLTFSVEVFPWKRAQELVERKKYDGFFVGSKNTKRDKYATFVGPLLHSFWQWYTVKDEKMEINPDGTPTSKDKIIGVVLGTNMHQWISSQPGYQVVAHTTSDQLFELLAAGRLDYVLATGAMYEESLKTLDSQFNILVARSKPLGLYLGHHFMEQHKELAAKIEKGATQCAP